MPFFIGAANLIVAMLWWALWLSSRRFGWPAMPEPSIFAGWLHAYVMQYQVLPSFIFGFLLTVFPRWTGLDPFPVWRYAVTGIGLVAGQAFTLAGAFGWTPGVAVGLLLTIVAWSAGLLSLGGILRHEKGITWHARSCYAALVLGLLGLLCQAAFVFQSMPLMAFISIKLGTFGLLLPIYFTVAHRMFPFFASGAVPDYVAWRPLWLLASAWGLLLLHLGLELAHAYPWLWLADLPLLALTGTVCWRWWPDGKQPPLLRVLFVGLLWLPLSFALYSAQSLTFLASGVYLLGRAPAHALFIGFFGSVLIAMVTRVTQGHSGRPLVLPRFALIAFVAIQLVALARIGAEFARDAMLWQVVSAAGWVLALTPWAIRAVRIYLSPRVDGKAG